MDNGKECDEANESDEAEDGDDFEAQVAKELASIKRPRKEQRFGRRIFIGAALQTRAKPLESELPDEHTLR